MSRSQNILLAGTLIFLAGTMRILNAELHIYHLAPVAALGLFSGNIVKNKSLAYLFPLLAMLMSDLFFQLFTSTPGFYGVEQLFVYGAMLLVTFLGSRMGQPKALKVAGYTLAGSLLFFVISNIGVWFSIQFGRVDLYGYGTGFQGLVHTFIAALPFYKSEMATSLFVNSIVGDMIFGFVLFGLYFVLATGRKTAMA